MSVAGYFGDGRIRVDLKKELEAGLHVSVIRSGRRYQRRNVIDT